MTPKLTLCLVSSPGHILSILSVMLCKKMYILSLYLHGVFLSVMPLSILAFPPPPPPPPRIMYWYYL